MSSIHGSLSRSFLFATLPVLLLFGLSCTGTEDTVHGEDVTAHGSPPPLSIPGTQVHTLTSEIAGRDFQILVALPMSYGEGEARYPVVYSLDADFMFAGAVEIARTLAYGLEAEEVILVGIGYGDSSLDEWQLLRRRDYTPTETLEEDAQMREASGDQVESLPDQLSGQAHRLHRVIQEEVQPFIEGLYRTRPEEDAFFGDSFGGLFGLYVLFHSPETFRHFMIGSPSIWWDNAVTLDFEEEYAAAHDDLPVDLFVSVGLLEEDPADPESQAYGMVSSVRTLVNRLQGRGYPSLRVESEYFEGETHMSVIPSNFSRALRVLFPGPGM